MAYNLKGLFIKEDESAPQKKVTTKQVSQPTPEKEEFVGLSCMMKGTPTGTPVSQQVPSTLSAEPNGDIVAKIWEMVIAKNLPGPDYIEFKNAAAGLVDITPDEAMQMKGAFNVLKQSHPDFTKKIILDSIDTYIGIVTEENNKGMKECEALRQQEVGEKIAKVASMKDEAAKILQEISNLKVKYDKLTGDITTVETEISSKTQELTMKENVFKASVQNVLDTLASDKEKVNNLNI